MRRETSEALPPDPGRNAWADSATRRALGVYALRAFGWFPAALVCVLASSPFIDESGDTKSGVPDFVPFVFIVPALFGVLLGVFSTLRLLQMTWSALRRPWLSVAAEYEELATSSTPNGQPVLFLKHDEQSWMLTLAAMKWRWATFGREPRLLLAAASGRSGLIATPDRSHVAWGGRSAYTAYLVWRGRRANRRHGPGRHARDG
jgi:hypothetical protein